MWTVAFNARSLSDFRGAAARAATAPMPAQAPSEGRSEDQMNGSIHGRATRRVLAGAAFLISAIAGAGCSDGSPSSH